MDEMEKFETYHHDVLVIGSGGAGLRAAIEASSAGVKVGVVCLKFFHSSIISWSEALSFALAT